MWRLWVGRLLHRDVVYFRFLYDWYFRIVTPTECGDFVRLDHGWVLLEDQSNVQYVYKIKNKEK